MHSLATAAPAAKAPKAYNPFQIDRRVRLVEITADNLALFESYSFTREGTETKHTPSVDLTSGAVHCNCEDFRYRHAKHNPTIFGQAHLCKHLVRAGETLARRRLLPQQAGQYEPKCSQCGAQGASLPLYDDTGNVVIGRICDACVEARYDDLADAAPDYEGYEEAWDGSYDAESRLAAPVPPHIDGTTGAVRPGWFQVVTPGNGFTKGQWVTREMVNAARPPLSAADAEMLAFLDFPLDDSDLPQC